MIEVVSAVIIRSGRILLTQRPADKDFPLMWECPGGKVDGNESHHDALRRELMEELALMVVIQPGQCAIWSGEFHNDVKREDRRHILLLMYPVHLEESWAPMPREWQGIGWFTAEEMAGLKLTPSNQKALGTIVAAMSMTKTKGYCPRRNAHTDAALTLASEVAASDGEPSLLMGTKDGAKVKKCLECNQPAREGSSFCSKQCREGSEHST